MNWHRIKGRWIVFKGRCRAQWGRLNDDDDELIRGLREQRAGLILQHQGPTGDNSDRPAGHHRRFAGERWTA